MEKTTTKQRRWNRIRQSFAIHHFTKKKMNVAFVLLPRSFNCAVLFVCVFPRFSSSHPVELFVLCCLGLLSWCIWTQLIPFELHILCHHEKIMLLAKDRIRYLLAEQTIKTTTIWSTTACIEPARGRQREREQLKRARSQNIFSLIILITHKRNQATPPKNRHTDHVCMYLYPYI